MLDLESFVENNELIINEFHWQKLNSIYSKDEIKEAISNVIVHLPLPLIPITEGDAKADFGNEDDAWSCFLMLMMMEEIKMSDLETLNMDLENIIKGDNNEGNT